MRQARRRVIAPYNCAYPEPLVIAEGTRVHVERRESEWSGWLWCTTTDGQAGWAPENWIALDAGGDTGVLRRGYSACELTVKTNDEVEVLEVESGWAWARAARGGTGWVPLECLEGEF